MLRALAAPIAGVLLAYAALRIGEIAYAGELHYVTRMDGYSLLFLTEMALLAGPAIALLAGRRTAGVPFFATTAVLVVLGGGLYRFSTFLFAFNPGPEWSYFPSLAEFAVTIGFISAEILGYLLIVKLFPILRGSEEEVRRGGPHPSPAGTSAGAPLAPLPGQVPVVARS